MSIQIPQVGLPVLNDKNTFTLPWLRFMQQLVKLVGTSNTVANLPLASDNIGVRSFVTDSTLPAIGNFGSILIGGGSNGVPVYSDGIWKIG